MATNASAGTLAARFVLDASGFKAEMLETGRISEREFKQLRRQLSFAKDYMNELGRSTKQVNEQVNMQKFSAEIERVAKAADLSNRQVANSMRYMPAQMTDVVTQLAGGQSPFLILIQQGGQMKDMFGGFRGMFAALTTYITPAAVALTALAAGVGTFAYAMYEASQDDKKFRDSVALSGNMAGATADRFKTHAAAIEASSQQTLSSANDITIGLIKTGSFSNRVMSEMGTAIARYADVSGESADKVIGEFARMNSGIAKWAAERNKQMNFITVEDYKRIAALEKLNKTEEAQLIVAERMIGHLKDQRQELGYLERALDATARGWSRLWNGIKNIGKESTLQEQLAAAQAKFATRNGSANPYAQAEANQLAVVIQDLRERIKLERQQADAQSNNARTNRDAIAKEIEDEGKRKKAASDAAALAKRKSDFIRDLNVDIQTYNNKSAEMEGTSRRLGEADKWAAEQKAKLLKNTDLLTKANQAQFSADIEAAATRMRTAIGTVSTKSFMSEIDAYNDKTAELEGRTKALGTTERWAADIKARFAKSTEGVTEAQRKSVDVAVDLAAARAKQAIATQEATKREAAMQELLRTKGLLNEDKKTFGDEYDVAAGKYLRNITDETKMAEQFVNGSFGRMEDAIVNWARTGKLSFSDLFSYMAEEYIRATIRMAAQSLLLNSAGNFVGWGALFSGLTTAKAPSAVPHAQGLEYVPRDGYMAMLHKGERVQTAVEAKQFRSGAQSGPSFDFSRQTVNVGQGVSRNEVAAALQQSQIATERRIRRLSREGVLN